MYALAYFVVWHAMTWRAMSGRPCVAAAVDAGMELDIEHAETAGAYTRPLLSSTQAVLVSEPFCVQFVTTYDPYMF
jgi:hypothetical protein